VVDVAGLSALGDDRPERASGGLEFYPVTVERANGGLKAERPERIADSLEPCRDGSRTAQPGRGGELATELLACLSKSARPLARGNLLDQKRDQLSQAPVWELDPFELRDDAIDLGRAPGSRPASAAPPFEHNREESGLSEAFEPAASDVAVDLELGGGLGGREGIAAAARVHEDPPKLRIARRGKSVERHARNATGPVDRTFYAASSECACGQRGCCGLVLA
jgi:hypothetical protein